MSIKLLLHILIITCIHSLASGHHSTIKTPTKKVTGDAIPHFSDDILFERLDQVIQRQLEFDKKTPRKGKIRFGKTTYPLSHVRKTLRTFLEVAAEHRTCMELAENNEQKESCQTKLNQKIRNQFDVFSPDLKAGDPRHGQEKDTFFTSYYTPTLKASRVRTDRFKYGIYKLPKNSRLRKATFNQIYFKDKLEGKNLALFYVEDLFELYFLHIQGGGKITFEENGQAKAKYVHYAGTNKGRLRWISKYMQAKGYIKDGKIESQREYLKKHPEKAEEIFSYSDSVVYYKEQSNPTIGSINVSLTDGRSIATDSKLYRYKGTLAFIQAQRPTNDSTPTNLEFMGFSRFMLDQDTGGAIRGKGRVDIFHGEDKYAELAAFNTKHEGKLFFLMLKK